jgi:basic membrane lipoprotein Med (substrate-binding protein (PBP1-ABC) superfamily)
VGAGSDVIIALVHGGVSPQIAAEAQTQGAYYIGSFGDETASAPEATVASVVVDFQDVYEEAVEGWTSGDFDASINTRGVAEGMIATTPLTLGFEDKQPQVDAALEQLRNGEITWPEGPCSAA